MQCSEKSIYIYIFKWTYLLTDISVWISHYFLKCHISKSEQIIFPTTCVSSSGLSISINNTTISPYPLVRVLGVILDSFQTQIQSLTKSCRLHLHNTSNICPFLTKETTKQLIHFFAISCLDYCKSLLICLPLCRLPPLQSSQNATVRLIHLTNHYPSMPIPPMACNCSTNKIKNANNMQRHL